MGPRFLPECFPTQGGKGRWHGDPVNRLISLVLPSARSHRLASLSALLWLGFTLVLPFVPAARVPGYEQALVTSVAVPLLLVPLLVQVARLSARKHAWPGLVVVGVGAVLGGLPALFTTMVGWMADTLCAMGPAAAHVLLGPVMSGATLGATARLAVGARPGKPWAELITLAVVGAFVGFTLWRLYAEPQAFMLDPFIGHFRGPIYDTGSAATAWDRPLALRALTGALILLALAMARAMDAWRAGTHRPSALAWLVASVVLVAATHAWTHTTLFPGKRAVLQALDTTHRTPPFAHPC